MQYSQVEKKAISISATAMASVWCFNVLTMAGLL